MRMSQESTPAPVSLDTIYRPLVQPSHALDERQCYPKPVYSPDAGIACQTNEQMDLRDASKANSSISQEQPTAAFNASTRMNDYIDHNTNLALA